jgi:hypothetical protein
MLTFSTKEELTARIDAYFNHIAKEFIPVKKALKKDKQAGGEMPEKNGGEQIPATIAGLALFLGFDSRQAFDDQEVKGKFAAILKRARLRIEAVYEKKLHQQSSSGAIFALKNLGWNEASGAKTTNAIKVLKVKIVAAGPKLAANEKEVTL